MNYNKSIQIVFFCITSFNISSLNWIHLSFIHILRCSYCVSYTQFWIKISNTWYANCSCCMHCINMMCVETYDVYFYLLYSVMLWEWVKFMEFLPESHHDNDSNINSNMQSKWRYRFFLFFAPTMNAIPSVWMSFYPKIDWLSEKTFHILCHYFMCHDRKLLRCMQIELTEC